MKNLNRRILIDSHIIIPRLTFQSTLGSYH